MVRNAGKRTDRSLHHRPTLVLSHGWDSVVRRYPELDEIPTVVVCPQKGDLSLIGPRPERPFFTQAIRARYSLLRLSHAGAPWEVTGWAQVDRAGTDDVADTVEKLTFDLYYIKHVDLARHADTREVGVDGDVGFRGTVAESLPGLPPSQERSPDTLTP